jgi:long-chain fatty acid transport protein
MDGVDPPIARSATLRPQQHMVPDRAAWGLVSPSPNQAWDVAFHAGYSRSHSPVTDLSFDPAFPDNDVHVASVGMGFLCRDGGKFIGLISCANGEKSFLAKSAIGLDVFYQALIFDARTVTGSPNPTVNGTYQQTTTHAGSVTMRVNF